MVVEWSCSGQILNEIIFSLWQVKVRYILLPGIFMKIFKVPIGRALSKKQWIPTGGSVEIWQEAECKKKSILQAHFVTYVCVPYQVSHNSVMITPILQHPKLPLARMTHIPSSMMKIIINLADTPSKSTVTNSLEKCDHCTQICHLLVWPLYQAQWWKL